ncbi:ABC-type bacteriocin/lantibiotic exporter with double-glycine peptidase domain [Bradyrhizobium sp. LM2.7]
MTRTRTAAVAAGSLSSAPRSGPSPRGEIELRNVCFRYAEGESLILNNVNLCVAPGQFVTIMGASGCGKSTLVKIMLGLLEPTSGEVLIDGLPLGQIEPRAYREQIGAVMQEDQLLSGSIADIICFFDTTFDLQAIIDCVRIAGIHEDHGNADELQQPHR